MTLSVTENISPILPVVALNPRTNIRVEHPFTDSADDVIVLTASDVNVPYAEVRVPEAIDVNVPNTEVIDVAEMEPPDMVVAVANKFVV